MITCSVLVAHEKRFTRKYDPLEDGSVIVLLEETDLLALSGGHSIGETTLNMTITMIDWASVFELEAILIDAVSTLIFCAAVKLTTSPLFAPV